VVERRRLVLLLGDRGGRSCFGRLRSSGVRQRLRRDPAGTHHRPRLAILDMRRQGSPQLDVAATVASNNSTGFISVVVSATSPSWTSRPATCWCVGLVAQLGYLFKPIDITADRAWSVNARLPSSNAGPLPARPGRRRPHPASPLSPGIPWASS